MGAYQEQREIRTRSHLIWTRILVQGQRGSIDPAAQPGMSDHAF